jgi:hypothetical protein
MVPAGGKVATDIDSSKECRVHIENADSNNENLVNKKNITCLVL